MTQNEILTVGSLAFDSIRTPAGRVDTALGGSGNYFSLCASFYSKIQLIGIVGGDFPKEHLSALQKRGVNTDGVQIIESGKTFHWAGEYDQNLNEAKTLTTHLNVFEHFDPKLNENQKKCSYLFLANIHPSLQLSVLKQVERPKLIACDTMNFWITGNLEELKKTLKEVDLLSINEGEAYLLSNKKSLLEAAESILKQGPKALIVKRGEYGAVLFTNKFVFMAPAFLVKSVIDPTGAGDSFAGALMGYLSKSGIDSGMEKTNPALWESTLRRAVLAGCAMASFAVEDFSINRLLTLTKPELKERESQILDMTQVK